MKINKVYAKQFKSVYDEVEIDFTQMNGLWKVSGRVGAGKTTMSEMILFGLYGSIKGRNVPDLISWGCNKGCVRLELESRGHTIIIDRMIRCKGQGELTILIDGEELSYTNKSDAQNILESDYYDCSRTAIESLCIIGFNNFKSIAQFSPGSRDTKKFVDDVFGFNVINQYIDICKNIINESQTIINNKTNKISAVEGIIQKYNDNIEDLFNKRDDIDEDGVNKELEEIEKEYSSNTKAKEYEKKVVSSHLDTLKKTANSIKTDVAILKKNIESVSSGKCPTCNSDVDKTTISSMKIQLNKKVEDHNNIVKQYNDSNTELKAINDNLDNLKSERDIKTRDIKNKLSDSIKQKESQIAAFRELITPLQKDVDESKESLLLDEIDLSKWVVTHDKLSKDLRPLLLQHFIPLLNSNIEFYIQALQQPYTITFDTLFNCSISVHGTENIPISSLSTGQLKTVNTSIIFGILKTLLNSINFNISFLDELFSNMHDDLREVTCRMIKENINMQVVFIITHAHIDDSLFDGEIFSKIISKNIDNNIIQSTTYTIS